MSILTLVSVQSCHINVFIKFALSELLLQCNNLYIINKLHSEIKVND